MGVKAQKTLLMVSPVPIPEAAKGAPVIATGEKIKLIVLDKPDIHFEQKITGYVVVDPWFYEKLIDCWNKNN